MVWSNQAPVTSGAATRLSTTTRTPVSAGSTRTSVTVVARRSRPTLRQSSPSARPHLNVSLLIGARHASSFGPPASSSRSRTLTDDNVPVFLSTV